MFGSIGHTARVHLYGHRYVTGTIVALASDADTRRRVYVMAHRDTAPDTVMPDAEVWLVPASALVTMPTASAA